MKYKNPGDMFKKFKEGKLFKKKKKTMKKKNWIADAIKKPGALHKELGIKVGKKISKKILNKAAKKGGKLGKRAQLAKTLASFHKKKIGKKNKMCK